MVEFAEERLDLGFSYGAVGGPQFKTSVTESKDGREQRNALWWLPLGRWQLGEKTLLESDIETIHEVQYLIDFHKYRQGSKIGFRYKDWCDYQAWDVELGTADGITTQWQLVKIYWAGPHKTYRPISKPSPDSVKIYFDKELQLSGYYVDYALGIVVFDFPPQAGIIISTDFEFDVPVCFEKDEISFEFVGYQDLEDGRHEAIYRLGSVFVEEIRISLNYPIFALESQLNSPLDLGIIFETTNKLEFSTSVDKLASGYTTRQSYFTNARNTISLPSLKLDKAEFDYLLGFFWNSKGQFSNFPFKFLNSLYWARFNLDQINIKFTDLDLFEISELNIQNSFDLSIKLNLLDFVDNETYIIPIIDTSGSMNDFIPQVESVILEIKQLLSSQNNININKYFKSTIFKNDERWVDWLSTDYRDNPTEPKKQIFLVWINESEPDYHGTGVEQPSPTYLADYSSLIDFKETQEKFAAMIFCIDRNHPATYRFINHLINAYLGTKNYPSGLKNYNVFIRSHVPTSAETSYYINALTS